MEYLIERFSEVLNVQHHFSIFLLIDGFYLVILSSLNPSMNKNLLCFFLIINFEKTADFEYVYQLMYLQNQNVVLTNNKHN